MIETFNLDKNTTAQEALNELKLIGEQLKRNQFLDHLKRLSSQTYWEVVRILNS